MESKKHKNLLLLDGVGAIISAIMLGGVLIYFQEYIGMPKSILGVLAMAATCFAIFSLSSYYRKSVEPKTALKTIGIVNITYCLASVGIVLYYYPQLTVLGITYFALEKIIVLTLAFIELKTAKQ